jgi:hypothetical protein
LFFQIEENEAKFLHTNWTSDPFVRRNPSYYHCTPRALIGAVFFMMNLAKSTDGTKRPPEFLERPQWQAAGIAAMEIVSLGLEDHGLRSHAVLNAAGWAGGPNF